MTSLEFDIENDFDNSLSYDLLTSELKNSVDINNVEIVSFVRNGNQITINFSRMLIQSEIDVFNLIVQNHNVLNLNPCKGIFIDIYRADEDNRNEKLQPGTSVKLTGEDCEIAPCENDDEPDGIVLDINDDFKHMFNYRITNGVIDPPLIARNDWNVIGIIGRFAVRKDNVFIKDSWVKIKDNHDDDHHIYLLK